MNECVKCIYCPDMNLHSDSDWEYSEDGTYKKMKPHREYRCLYDNHVIKNWEERCPKSEKEL